MFTGKLRYAVVLLTILVLAAYETRAEEGMWTFDNPPIKLLQEKYGFTPTQSWLDHVRLSSVRLNDGGSGSFVSPDGLLLTNHHVARGQLQKNSTAEHDYIRDGFYADTPDKEMKSPDLEVNVLIGMENVTALVQGAAKGISDQAKAMKAREAEIARIEKESKEKTGLRSDIVSLYQGGEYWLYTYKAYTDVRIVFAPEQQAAFFGGDPDNFTFPRYDLDMALFRVYDNGKPLHTENYGGIDDRTPNGRTQHDRVPEAAHRSMPGICRQGPGTGATGGQHGLRPAEQSQGLRRPPGCLGGQGDPRQEAGRGR